ncbi:hypothetical protein CPB84DRAFT_1850605 [Gymnopilus junonius]|uniref:Uncharacterized protein n=1 Tax=Gymnopilus junonius TaxID=109634 RepID=A0A9P5NHW7_GYMJU|nr:hypothetical protein CPB84DRAFT_1850605 [Gymnopilus junonius]
MKYFTYLIMLSVVGNFASVTFSAPIKIEKVFGHDNFYNQNPNPLTDHQPAHLAAIQIATDKGTVSMAVKLYIN